MKKLIKYFVVAFMLLFGVSGLFASGQKDVANNDNINVLTSFYPVYFFTNEIAQDKVNVKVLVPTNTEPHDYELTAKDMITIQNSKIVFYNTKYMESFIDAIKDTVDSDTKFVEVSRNINLMKASGSHHHHHHHHGEDVEHHDGDEEHHGEDEEHHHTDEDHHGENEEHHHADEDHDGENEEHHHELELSTDHQESFDPHTWLSPVAAQSICNVIYEELIKIDPNNKDFYKANLDKTIEKLIQLDNAYRSQLSNTSKDDIITSHMAFGYLANLYNFNQIPLRGLDSEDEPNAQDLAKIADYAREHEINVIFTEELVSPKVSNILGNELGIDVRVLSPLEGLSDEDSANNEDYFSIMYRNLEEIKKALQ